MRRDDGPGDDAHARINGLTLRVGLPCVVLVWVNPPDSAGPDVEKTDRISTAGNPPGRQHLTFGTSRLPRSMRELVLQDG